MKNKGMIGKCIILACFAMVCIVAYVFLRCNTGDLIKAFPVFEATESSSIQLYDSQSVEQLFTVEDNQCMTGLSLYFTNEKSYSENGWIDIALYDNGTNELLYSGEFQSIDCGLEGESKNLFFDRIDTAGRTLKLIVSTRWIGPEDGISLNVFTTADDTGLTLNGEKLSYNVELSTLTEEKDTFITVEKVVCLLVCLAVTAAFVMFFMTKSKVLCKLENVYLVVGLLMGLAYLILFPIMSIPDEYSHAHIAYELSNKFMGVESVDGLITMRGDDAAFGWTIENVGREGINGYWEGAFNRVDNSSLVTSNAPIQESDKFMYVLPAVGITLGRLMNLSTVMTFLLGRLLNTIIYVIAIYFAIRLIPFGKSTLFVWSMLPIMLQQVNSYSYDSFVMAASALIISITLNIYYNDDYKSKSNSIFKNILMWIGRPKVIAMVIICLLLSKVKGHALFPVSILPLIIPARYLFRRRKSVKNYISTVKRPAKILLAIAVLVAVTCVSYIGARVIQNIISAPDSGNIVNWAGAEGYTMGYLLKNPITFAEIIIRTIYGNVDFFVTSMLGGYLGALDVIITKTFVYVYLILLVLSAIRKSDEMQPMKIPERIYMYIVFGLVCLVAIVGMLISWTPYAYNMVQGVQGRYFLPALPLVFIAARSKKWCRGENSDKIIGFMGVAMHLIIIMDIFKTFARWNI